MVDPAVLASEHKDLSPATEQALGLFADPLPSEGIDDTRGYLDLLGQRDPTGTRLGQRLMVSRVLPLIYQRFWRPLGGRPICCFAALYLIEEPMRALAEIVRVLAPAGRVALLTSCNRGLLPAGAASTIVRGLSGVRVFGRDELTRALRNDGLVEIDQHVSGLAQFISGRKPEVV